MVRPSVVCRKKSGRGFLFQVTPPLQTLSNILRTFDKLPLHSWFQYVITRGNDSDFINGSVGTTISVMADNVLRKVSVFLRLVQAKGNFPFGA